MTHFLHTHIVLLVLLAIGLILCAIAGFRKTTVARLTTAATGWWIMAALHALALTAAFLAWIPATRTQEAMVAAEILLYINIGYFVWARRTNLRQLIADRAEQDAQDELDAALGKFQTELQRQWSPHPEADQW